MPSTNLGGWHSWYNSNRAISNELGGKWELVDEFTMRNAEPIIYDEYPSGERLNINGVMIVMSGTVTNNLTVNVINKNNEIIYSRIVLTTTNTESLLTNKRLNGFNHIYSTRSDNAYNNAPMYVSLLGCTTSFDSDYVQLNFSGGGEINVNCKVYMLRGV